VKNLKAGTRVRLLANDEEGWDEEVGTILEGPENEHAMDPISETYGVEIDEEYQQGRDDDRIREVSEDQVVPLEEATP
jgi:hypothetical protein